MPKIIRPETIVFQEDTKGGKVSHRYNDPRFKIQTGSDRYIGIDPGKQGGLVCLSKTEVLSAIPMPDSERDIWEWFDEYRADLVVTKALIESVSAMRDQGVTSMFTFGQGYGFLRCCLIGHKIPFEEVRPQKWQKHYSLSGKMEKPERKEKQRAKAQQIFPELPIWSEPRTKGKQLAIADALLIANFCREVNK
jgi:crossover junction endodeoxyribonuclease RuvC